MNGDDSQQPAISASTRPLRCAHCEDDQYDDDNQEEDEYDDVDNELMRITTASPCPLR